MKLCSFILVVFVASWASAQENQEDDVELSVPQGRLRGKRAVTPSGRTFYTFFGLPFAKAPVGQLRLRDPEKWENWEGVLDATKQPLPCKQIDYFVAKKVLGTEDCLFLNVYTPQLPNSDSNSTLPVLVFIHGGGFTSGHVAMYDATPFMDYDVVVVLMQYRVGVLGFLSTRDSVVPGNFGLKDQTMALRWVQHNIAHFSGDPSRVTLFGQSAGGGSVHFHVLSPLSAGLFSKAIMQSGTALASWAMEIEDGILMEDLAAMFNCSSESQQLLRCLQEVPVERLVELIAFFADVMLFPNYFMPRVDGRFLPDKPEVLMSKGLQNDVDIISGYTKEEGAMASSVLRAARRNNWCADNFAHLGEEIFNIRMCKFCYGKLLDYYIGHRNFSAVDPVEEGFIELFTDSDYLIPHEIVGLHSTKRNLVSGKSTFLYEFRYLGSVSFANILNVSLDRKYVFHGDDMFYLFNVFVKLRREEDFKMRDVFLKTWVNFATTGNPTPDDSLGFKWQPASTSSLQRLILLPSPYMECDRNHEKRAFWNTLNVERFRQLLDDEPMNPSMSDSQTVCGPQ